MTHEAYVVVDLPGGACQEVRCAEVTAGERAVLLSGCDGWDAATPEGFDVPAGSEVHVPHERVVSIVYPEE